MNRPDRQRSLQDALRARREERKLITPGELARREAARRQEEAETVARALAAAWRSTGKSVDGRTRLAAEVYAALFTVDPEAYAASREWGRLNRAQIARVAACEVAACRSTSDVRAYQRRADGTAELLTLCPACLSRTRLLARKLRRPPTEGEISSLDPTAPLYDRGAIANLREKYEIPGVNR